MPELVEVELARRALQSATAGRALEAVEVLDPRLSVAPFAELSAWRRHGKQLVGEGVGLDGRPVALLVHLGMTGQWRVDAPAPGPAPKHTRLRFCFADAPRRVDFVDPRRFGDVRAVSVDEAHAAFDRLGPDAWSQPWTLEQAHQAWRGSRVPLQHALMDQQRLAGLGNIASTEIAYRAGLHPLTPVGRLGSAELERVLDAVQAHLAYLFEVETEAELTYVSMGGRNPFRVYGRAGQPCPGCGSLVTREVCRGRSAFWCPSFCQQSARV